MKKAFTLVEVLTVIVLLGLISFIIYPKVNDIIKNQSNKIRQDNINIFINGAKEYAIIHEAELGNTNYSVSISLLKEEKIIQNKEYKDSSNNTIMNGCVNVNYIVTKEINNYEYVDTCDE